MTKSTRIGLVFFFSLLAAVWVPALGGLDDNVREIVRAGGMGGAKVAVVAMDLDTGEELVALQADRPMIPASNMKLVTSAAALHVLGPQFVFETQLLQAGDSTKEAAVLVVRGDGDPAFGDPQLIGRHDQLGDVEDMLKLWVKAVQDAGITAIDQLIIDDRVFDRQFVHHSWPEAQLNKWYCAQVAGLNFHDNCLDVYARPTKYGESPAVTIKPYLPDLPSTNSAKTGKANTFWVSRKIGSNQMGFHGQVKNKIAPVHVTVHDPPLVFGHIFADRLGKAGITVGSVTRPTLEQHVFKGKILHRIRTPITSVLGRCNKDSQNMFGEALLKRMGREFTGAPGGFDNGASAVRTFLSQRALKATGAANITVADGSGMSRENRVTARAMVNLLKYMQADDPDPSRRQVYRDSLSVGGADGTLRMRFIKGFHGKVYGKSGYLNGVSTLSGYVVYTAAEERPGGAQVPPRTIAFSILFNESKRPAAEMKTVQNRIVAALDDALHRTARSPQPAAP